jgi:hypothetical protein
VTVFISGPDLVDEVEGRVGGMAEAAEPGRDGNLAQALLASLRPRARPTGSDSECGTCNSVGAA